MKRLFIFLLFSSVALGAYQQVQLQFKDELGNNVNLGTSISINKE